MARQSRKGGGGRPDSPSAVGGPGAADPAAGGRPAAVSALVATTVHGRYLLRPADAGGAAPLLVAFHGYGENAERLVAEVEKIPGIEAWHLAAIQALHPFYNNRTGEVVASWMTKLDREAAITDNLAYVAAALEAIENKVETVRPHVFLGFSQGTAMAYRAAAGAGRPCHAVVALGGDVPPELSATGARLPGRVLIGRGHADNWYDDAKLAADQGALAALGVEVETCLFTGGHEWTAEFRRRCADFLGAL